MPGSAPTCSHLAQNSLLWDCPVYALEIFEGSVRYVGTNFVRVLGEQRTIIPRDRVENLISSFLRADYFSLRDAYETYTAPDGTATYLTDLPTTYTTLQVGNRKKSVKDYAFAPDTLKELEFEVDRVANSHRWIRGDNDDLKQWEIVGSDVYRRITPGMTRFMQAAGKGDLKELARVHVAGVDLNASDETGWTALMFAAAMCQEQSVRLLMDWGATVDLRDKNGDTALIAYGGDDVWESRCSSGVIRRESAPRSQR